MSETIAILGAAFLCGTSMLLAKLCRMRAEVENPPADYLFITKAHYEDLQRAAKREIIIEQPQLPVYSEKSSLLSDDTISI
jgi:hypothetical protein